MEYMGNSAAAAAFAQEGPLLDWQQFPARVAAALGVDAADPAAAESRLPRVGSAAYHKVPLTGALQSTFPA